MNSFSRRSLEKELRRSSVLEVLEVHRSSNINQTAAKMSRKKRVK